MLGTSALEKEETTTNSTGYDDENRTRLIGCNKAYFSRRLRSKRLLYTTVILPVLYVSQRCSRNHSFEEFVNPSRRISDDVAYIMMKFMSDRLFVEGLFMGKIQISRLR